MVCGWYSWRSVLYIVSRSVFEHLRFHTYLATCFKMFVVFNCHLKENALFLRFSLHFNGHFPGEPELAVVKDDVSAGDNWSYKSCKAPVRSSLPTNQHPVFLQAGCPSCRPTNSVKALKEKYHIPGTCLPQAHMGFFQLCL